YAEPRNVTVLASANADAIGFYVIAGSELPSCYFPRRFGLRLYADKLSNYPVKVNGSHDPIYVPDNYVFAEKEPVKVFEKDIDGVLSIIS
ncbi:hypothetical protein AAVH_29366, partial [Aphelenchoides avenae]